VRPSSGAVVMGTPYKFFGAASFVILLFEGMLFYGFLLCAFLATGTKSFSVLSIGFVFCSYFLDSQFQTVCLSKFVHIGNIFEKKKLADSCQF